jgi:tetratricopeptide (TPR) repeat protein
MMDSSSSRTTAEDLYQQAIEHRRKFQYDLAVECCQQALNLSPEFVPALNLQAETLLFLAEWDLALDCCDRLLTLTPNDYSVWDTRGFLLTNLKRVEEAINSVNQAIALTPEDSNDADAWFDRGHFFREFDLNDQAAECFQRAAEIVDQSDSASVDDRSETWSNLGYHYFSQGQYEAAIASFEKAPYMRIRDTEAQWLTALIQVGRKDEILPRYTALVEAEPDSDAAWERHGQAMVHLEHYEAAIDSYKRALRLNPDRDCWLFLERVLEKLGQLSLLPQVYDELLELYPNHVRLWVQKGAVLERQGDTAGALASYDHALSLDLNTQIAWSRRIPLLEDLGRFEESIASYKRSVELIATQHSSNKKYVRESWVELGDFLFSLNRYEEAVEAYSHAPFLEFDREMNRNEALIALGRESEVTDHE